jgi:hypothetical protein
VLDYPVEELLAMTFTEFTHPDYADLDWKLFTELVRGERTHSRSRSATSAGTGRCCGGA